jgi:4-hydroxy-tetrahydrodipicolinate synthase
MPRPDRFGLSCALATPFDADGAVDHARLVSHVRGRLAADCDSVTVFGTTGEGSSLGLSARQQILGALKGAGIDLRAHVLGAVAAASVEDALAQTRLLLDAGCRGVLLTPPFYFKNVSDDGLFAWFSALFEALNGRARDVIVYNIPSVSAVALSVELIGRLRTAFPDAIMGVKDSSGDWPYTERLLAAHRDIAILIGDERHLARGVQLGAEGAISGLANICPDRLLPLIRAGQADERIAALVDEVLKYPVTPAVKALIAHRTGDAAWLNVRPPLVPIGPADAARLTGAFEAIFAAEVAE